VRHAVSYRKAVCNTPGVTLCNESAKQLQLCGFASTIDAELRHFSIERHAGNVE